jgi:fructokinase
VALLKTSPAGVLHTGSLMAMPPEHDKVLQIIAEAKRLGWVISVDMNIRPRVASDVPAYLQAVRAVAAQADWLKASDEDLELLGFTDVSLSNASTLAQHWIAQGCSRLALTFGEHGAFLQVNTAHVQAAAPVIDVKDTVGAGDTFWGSCLADWVMQGIPTNDLQAADRIALTLQCALVAAAINCSRQGCRPPTSAEISNFKTV